MLPFVGSLFYLGFVMKSLLYCDRKKYFVTIAKNAPGGGCFGEPPSAKLFCRDCEERLGGWLLRRAPECQVIVSRLRRMPRGVAASANPRVPSYCVAIVKNASGGGCFGEP